MLAARRWACGRPQWHFGNPTLVPHRCTRPVTALELNSHSRVSRWNVERFSTALSTSNHQYAGKLIAFAAIVESGTGIAVIIGPVLIVRLLLGEQVAGVGVAVARCFGVALFSLGLACWPTGAPVRSDSAAFRAMLAYNALIAVFLVYLAATGVSGTKR